MDSDGVGWTDEDDALVAYEGLPDWHPSLFVDVFRTALSMSGPDATRILRDGFVTPESVADWTDFSRARSAFLSGLKISMSALYGVDAPDVAYVRLVETSLHLNPDMTEVPATMYATLVWRPEIAMVPGSGWRIHHLGAPQEPSLIPRTAPGFDPRL